MTHTLSFIRDNDKILLAMKKRGFGEGRWNGYGGKIDKEESPSQAAKRETKEEIDVSVSEIEEMGVIDFHMPNQYLKVHLFLIKKWTGEPKETEEMKPKWFDIKEIPYKHMWPDDSYWLPIFLNNVKIKGKFWFDEKDQVIDFSIQSL